MRIVAAFPLLAAAAVFFPASDASGQALQRSAVGQIPITAEDEGNPVTPQEEHLCRVDRAQEIEALDEDLFGDSINNYTGAVTFSVTDVSLPGNNELPVALTRRFDVNDVRGSGARPRSGHVLMRLLKHEVPRRAWKAKAQGEPRRLSAKLR